MKKREKKGQICGCEVIKMLPHIIKRERSKRKKALSLHTGKKRKLIKEDGRRRRSAI